MITERIGFSLARFLTTKQSQSKEAGHQLETTTYAVVAFVLVFIRGQRTQGSAVVTGCWCSLSFDMYPIFSPDPSEAPHIATHRQMLDFPMCILGAEISASLREPRLIWRSLLGNEMITNETTNKNCRSWLLEFHLICTPFVHRHEQMVDFPLCILGAEISASLTKRRSF